MSESHHDSYYEVALSHRQVVWVFVVLLGCVVAAFLSGVWIGQQQTSPALVAALAEGQDEEPRRKGRELEDLNFFSDESAAPQPAVATPAAGTTLADDLDAVPPEAARAPATGPRDEPAVEPEVASEVAPVTPPAVAERAPEASPEPAPAVAAPEAPPAGEGLVIQVFSSPDRVQAEQVVERLRGSGHPAFLSPVEVDGRPMFRVRIGPFAERARAERVAESVRRSFKLDTWITQNT